MISKTHPRGHAQAWAHLLPMQSDTSDVVRRWRPALRRISAITGDSSFLVVRSGSEALCMHREYGSYPEQVMTVTPGQRQPLGIGAGGLALLAALPPHEADHAIRLNTAALRAYPGMAVDVMARLVAETRARGWALVTRTATPGLAGVGIACCDSQGYPRVGLSIASSRDRMPPQRQIAIAVLLRSYGQQAMQTG
jgi:DNA-binding IclR family transcriptional regulator